MIKSYKLRRTLSNTFIYIFLSIMAIIWVLPLAWLIMTSFRGEQQVYINYVIPKTWTLDNYIHLFTQADPSGINPPLVHKHTCCCCLLMRYLYGFSFDGQLYIQPSAF